MFIVNDDYFSYSTRWGHAYEQSSKCEEILKYFKRKDEVLSVKVEDENKDGNGIFMEGSIAEKTIILFQSNLEPS